MRWFAVNVERVDSPEYLEIDPEVRADHLAVLTRCARRDNSGVFRGAAAWGDRQCLAYMGLGREQLDALVAAHLAAWAPTEAVDRMLADLTPGEDQELGDVPDDRRWTGPQHIAVAAVRDHAMRDHASGERSRDVRSLDSSAPRDLSAISEATDLVVFDYDLFGQVRNARKTEVAEKANKVRWGQAQQLPLVPTSRDRPVRQQSDLSPITESLTESTARHGTDPTPPKAPPRGGGRSPRRGPTPDERSALEGFWAWLHDARPASLDRFNWGGARRQTFAAICGTADEEGLTVVGMVERLRLHLEQAFRDTRWVDENTKRCLKTYVPSGDWQTPVTQRRPVLQVVPPPTEDLRRLEESDRVAFEETFPGETWPGPEEARRRLFGREKNRPS